jgi:hypothetical protein
MTDSEIFSHPQLIGADWKISGSLSVVKGGNTLSLSGDGLRLLDATGKVLFSLDMLGNVEGVFIPALSISPNQLTGRARSQFGVLFETFDDELAGWTYLINSTSPTFPLHGEAGGKVLRVVSEMKIVNAVNIPYDPSKTYRIRLRVRKLSGTGTVSAGVVGITANGVTKVATSGANTFADPHFTCMKEDTPSSSWGLFTGWFKGVTSSPLIPPSTDPTLPKALKEGIKYIRPFIHMNVGGGTAVIEVDDITIDVGDDLSPGSVTSAIVTSGVTASDSIAPSPALSFSLGTDFYFDDTSEVLDVSGSIPSGYNFVTLTVTGTAADGSGTARAIIGSTEISADMATTETVTRTFVQALSSRTFEVIGLAATWTSFTIDVGTAFK